MARTIAIWVSGLMASTIIGGGIGAHINQFEGTFFGMIAGPAAFACVRLWLGELRR
jgi:hypothetical protein